MDDYSSFTELQRACTTIGLSPGILSPEEWSALFLTLKEKYLRQDAYSTILLFDFLDAPWMVLTTIFPHRHPPQIVRRFASEEIIVLLCENKRRGLVFASPEEFADALDACNYYFEFNFTNRRTSYLACYSHEKSFLISGEVPGWVPEYPADIE